jgi:hypothetical protein
MRTLKSNSYQLVGIVGLRRAAHFVLRGSIEFLKRSGVQSAHELRRLQPASYGIKEFVNIKAVMVA